MLFSSVSASLFDLADYVVDEQGEDGPIDSKADPHEWRRRIGKIEEWIYGSEQYDFYGI